MAEKEIMGDAFGPGSRAVGVEPPSGVSPVPASIPIATASPFVPGARVAVRGTWDRESYREAFVDRVYKSGNFTLRGDTSRQQWRPWRSSWVGMEWHASQTGDGWLRDDLVFWDEATDKTIREGIAATKRRGRWLVLRKRLEALKEGEITDGLLSALDAALAQGIEAFGRDAASRLDAKHESATPQSGDAP